MATRTVTYGTRLPFIVDPSSIDRDTGRVVNWAAIPTSYRQGISTATITVDTAGAAANATTVPVLALPVAIPTGTLLDFGAKKFARTNALAAVGATSLTVDAIPTALVSGDVATHRLPTTIATGRLIPAGTVMAEMADGSLIPRAISGALTATCILATNADELSTSDALSGYGTLIGGAVFENMLPEATGTPKTITSGWKTELQTAGVGTGFAFRQYGDNRA